MNLGLIEKLLILKNKTCLSVNRHNSRKVFKILESKTGFKTGLLLEIFYLRKHFFEEISFLDPHLFGLTKRIFDDRIFFGS